MKRNSQMLSTHILAPTMIVNCVIAAAAALLLSTPLPARAASLETFVSVFGSDNNAATDCRRDIPCRGISAALAVTSPGGVLTVLDSGRFGSFTVTRSVQVVAASGVQALVVPSSATAVQAALINAPGAQVTLRGLTFFAETSTVASGINVTSVESLHVENCVLTGFGFAGINVDFVPAGPLPAEVSIFDTVVKDCRTAGHGITVKNNGAQGTSRIMAVIERARVENCSSGISIQNSVDAVVRDSVSSGNNIMGIFAGGTLNGRRAEMVVDNCLVTGNEYGIASTGVSGGEAGIDVVGTTITFNLAALRISGPSQVRSGGGNTVLHNTENTAFSTTPPP